MSLSLSVTLRFFLIWFPVSLSRYLSVFLSVRLSCKSVSCLLYFYLSVFCGSLSVCLSVWLSLYLSPSVFAFVSVRLFVYLADSAVICFSVWICLSMWLYARFLPMFRRPITKSLLTWDDLTINSFTFFHLAIFDWQLHVWTARAARCTCPAVSQSSPVLLHIFKGRFTCLKCESAWQVHKCLPVYILGWLTINFDSIIFDQINIISKGLISFNCEFVVWRTWLSFSSK